MTSALIVRRPPQLLRLPSTLLQRTRDSLEVMLDRIAIRIPPPARVSTLQWLTENFHLPETGADLPGAYNPDYVPYLWGVFAALDDPLARLVVMQKAAQIGWTFGLIGWLGKRIHVEPSAIIALFPKDGTAREFSDEKLVPAIKASPVLAALVDVTTSRKDGNRALFKRFPGGFLKLAGSHSVSNVKSTPAPIVIVEEPDDTKENVKEQGDSLRLVRERLKRFRAGKMVLGGTPSVAGLSRVEEYMSISTQRVLPIECHGCGDSHVLDWENVSWLSDEEANHPVFGTALTDTAIYACPHCGEAWDDYTRQQNILETVRKARESGDPYCGWVTTTEVSGGVEGFKELNELYVCLPGTRLADVARDFLEAEHQAAQGDENARIVFVNSKLGRPYEYQGDQDTADTLRERALDYAEMVCPRDGLIVTVGIDVQHDRLAVIIRAWGRGEESWLLYWGELPASQTCVDKNDPVWAALDKLLFSPVKHDAGGAVMVSAISIDCSDGGTSDAVYEWVRTRNRKHPRMLIMAVKGSSAQQDPEIFTHPRQKSVDHRRPDKQTKADRRGVRVFLVGTNKAKDWLASHMKLGGTGPGRWHFYQGVRTDYFEQITAEVKAPHRSIRNRKIWQLRSGRRNEGTDCEVYALHAARGVRVHLKKPAEWDALAAQIQQSDLFAEAVAPALPAVRRAAGKSGNLIGYEGSWL